MATQGTATIPAGETEIIVDHTYGSDEYYAHITPLTELGGRDYWAPDEDQGVATFKIKISSMDLADHKFRWILSAAPEAPTPMDHYSTVAQVKEILRIATVDTDPDAEILNCIIDVDEEIKTEFRTDEITVPAAADVDEGSSLNRASKYLAAYTFRNRSPTAKMHTEINRDMFFSPGRLALDKYKRENNTNILFRTGEAV